MHVRKNIIFSIFFSCLLFGALIAHAESPLLTPQENLWLQERNNTIVVYPEQNDPPFSYQSASGIIQGLSVDYIELIAKKIGVNIEYLTPRSHSQILTDAAAGKGDVILSLAPTTEREREFVFTEPYATVPFVIVVRKDLDTKSSVTLADYGGKRVALTEGSVIEGYVRQNFSRVIIEDVTDDEAALQQVVLGQVDAATMDVASLSFLLSKQVLSSVKVVGNVGYDYRVSFAMAKDKEILQSVLERGLSQISDTEKQALQEKWTTLPKEDTRSELLQRLQSGTGILVLYVLFAVVVIAMIILLLRRRVPAWRRFRRNRETGELQEELSELEQANRTLTGELEQVRHLEEDIEEKLKRMNVQQ